MGLVAGRPTDCFWQGSPANLWIFPVRGGDAVAFALSPFNKTQAQVSPDGRWIVYTALDTGHDEVYVDSFPVAGNRRQVSVGGGMQPRWRRDGSELFYLAPDQMLMAVPVTSKRGYFEAGRATPLFATRLVPIGSQISGFGAMYDVTPDGQRFLINGPPADRQNCDRAPYPVIESGRTSSAAAPVRTARGKTEYGRGVEPPMEKTPNPRAAGRRLVLLCGVAPALLTAALAIITPSLFGHLDRRAYDSLVRSLPSPADPPRVAIVDIDDRSLGAIGQWPWSRDVVARLITRLRDLGASVVALDIVFPESDRFDRVDAGRPANPDAELASALRSTHAVVGYAFTFTSPTQEVNDCVLHPLTLPVLQPGNSNADVPVFRATGVVCSLPLLANAAGGSGFLNAVPDPDGMLRRLPLVIEREGRLYPGLGLAAAMAATNAHPVALRIQNVNAASLVFDAGEVPLDGRSNLLLRYRGGNHSLPYISAVDVLEGHRSSTTIKDAIVIVGTTAIGARDGVSTPFDTVFPGVEVQATIADNLLRRDFISRPPDALTIEMAGVLALGVAVTMLVARLGLAWGSGAGMLLFLGVWRGSAWLIETRGYYYSPVLPAIGLIASLIAATLAKLAHERHRAQAAAAESDAAHRMMIQSLLSLTEIRDAETGNHSRRTQQYSRLLAHQLRDHPRFREFLTAPHIELLSTLAPLHDIGKVGVPDQLLNKPGSLTDDEYREMKKHPVYGLNVITTAQKRARADDDEILTIAKDIVYTHHERWDGHGYPRGLKGEQIPIPGRLMAIVDVYDALTTTRCYRAPMPHDRAVEVIVNGEGTHFDPAVVDAFVRTAALLRRVADESTDTAFVAAASQRAASVRLSAQETGPPSAAH